MNTDPTTRDFPCVSVCIRGLNPRLIVPCLSPAWSPRQEKGYRLLIDSFEALGKKTASVEVRCHDLKDQGVEGLIGMTFLKQFDWCLHPAKQVLAVR